MFNKNKLLSIISLFSLSSFSFALANIETVTMINATYCHITPSGHVRGYASHLGTFTEDGSEYSFIAPGEAGKIPLITKNGYRYIILDHADASDKYGFDYTSDKKYILGIEGTKAYCTHEKFPPCLTISATNPCGAN